MRVGRFPFQALPYYTQKAMWLLLMTTAPLALGTGITLVAIAISRKKRALIALSCAVPVGIALLPWALGFSPDAGLTNIRNPRVQWFVAAYLHQTELNERSVAFNPDDRIGSHVANLALRLVSSHTMPPELSLQADPPSVCHWISTNQVDRVYTSEIGRGDLTKAGCSDQGIEYLVGP